jgi:YD repeat-containing protein
LARLSLPGGVFPREMSDYAMLPLLSQSGPVTITYTYDPLYRLTAADYSTGESFDYTCDAVGNRLTQTTITNTTVYTYDIANRLVNVGGVAYRWDNTIGTGCKSKTPASDDRGFLFQIGGVNYALAPTGTGMGRLFFLSRPYG